jgi:hypothetical protein
MNLETAIEILREYNLWRRGEMDRHGYTPKQVGLAIDFVVEEFKKEE